MKINVKRKDGAERITRFSHGPFPVLEFDVNVDEFEIPIEFLADLRNFFDPYFPESSQEQTVKKFMIGDKEVQL